MQVINLLSVLNGIANGDYTNEKNVIESALAQTEIHIDRQCTGQRKNSGNKRMNAKLG